MCFIFSVIELVHLKYLWHFLCSGPVEWLLGEFSLFRCLRAHFSSLSSIGTQWKKRVLKYVSKKRRSSSAMWFYVCWSVKHSSLRPQLHKLWQRSISLIIVLVETWKKLCGCRIVFPILCFLYMQSQPTMPPASAQLTLSNWTHEKFPMILHPRFLRCPSGHVHLPACLFPPMYVHMRTGLLRWVLSPSLPSSPLHTASAAASAQLTFRCACVAWAAANFSVTSARKYPPRLFGIGSDSHTCEDENCQCN